VRRQGLGNAIESISRRQRDEFGEFSIVKRFGSVWFYKSECVSRPAIDRLFVQAGMKNRVFAVTTIGPIFQMDAFYRIGTFRPFRIEPMDGWISGPASDLPNGKRFWREPGTAFRTRIRECILYAAAASFSGSDEATSPLTPGNGKDPSLVLYGSTRKTKARRITSGRPPRARDAVSATAPMPPFDPRRAGDGTNLRHSRELSDSFRNHGRTEASGIATATRPARLDWPIAD